MSRTFLLFCGVATIGIVVGQPLSPNPQCVTKGDTDLDNLIDYTVAPCPGGGGNSIVTTETLPKAVTDAGALASGRPQLGDWWTRWVNPPTTQYPADGTGRARFRVGRAPTSAAEVQQLYDSGTSAMLWITDPSVNHHPDIFTALSDCGMFFDYEDQNAELPWKFLTVAATEVGWKAGGKLYGNVLVVSDAPDAPLRKALVGFLEYAAYMGFNEAAVDWENPAGEDETIIDAVAIAAKANSVINYAHEAAVDLGIPLTKADYVHICGAAFNAVLGPHDGCNEFSAAIVDATASQAWFSVFAQTADPNVRYLYSIGGVGVYAAGQVTKTMLDSEAFKTSNIGSVINLRAKNEATNPSADPLGANPDEFNDDKLVGHDPAKEGAYIKALRLLYLSVPVAEGQDAVTYAAEFANVGAAMMAAIKAADDNMALGIRNVLVHCSDGFRATAFAAAFLGAVLHDMPNNFHIDKRDIFDGATVDATNLAQIGLPLEQLQRLVAGAGYNAEDDRTVALYSLALGDGTGSDFDLDSRTVGVSREGPAFVFAESAEFLAVPLCELEACGMSTGDTTACDNSLCAPCVGGLGLYDTMNRACSDHCNGCELASARSCGACTTTTPFAWVSASATAWFNNLKLDAGTFAAVMATVASVGCDVYTDEQAIATCNLNAIIAAVKPLIVAQLELDTQVTGVDWSARFTAMSIAAAASCRSEVPLDRGVKVVGATDDGKNARPEYSQNACYYNKMSLEFIKYDDITVPGSGAAGVTASVASVAAVVAAALL